MTNTIQLQEIGLVKGTPAGQIKVGTTLLWNFGHTSKVKAITKETQKSIWFITETKEGNTYTRRFLKTRVIGTL
tara:strand:- start:590 stop:811 length:222 start_codon:yes stop_codon:yes gene_type:complete